MPVFGIKLRRGESKRDEEVRELEEAFELPFPDSSIPEPLVGEEGQRSYEEVAEALGFAPAELTNAQLISFFSQEGIKLYDYDQVSKWLTKKREEASTKLWCWRPLRDKDVMENVSWGWSSDGYVDGYYRSGHCTPYARLVPQHALEKVMKLEKKFGNRVKFFVSGYPDPKPDPFIMVRSAMSSDGGDTHFFVFDVWDEPGFGD
jgi:hypothetical protein